MKRIHIPVNFILCCIITVALALIGGFCFQESFLRFAEACKGFGYLIIGEGEMINQSSKYVDSIVPFKWDDAVAKLERFFNAFIDKENALGYFSWTGELLLVLCYAALFGIISVLIVIMLAMFNFSGHKTEEKNSGPLNAYLKFEHNVWIPLRDGILDFIEYTKTSRFRYIWSVILVFSLNGATIIVGAISWYFYFVSNFDFVSIWTQLYKLFADISILWRIPWYVWIVLVWIGMCVWRKRRAIENLNKRESHNVDVIENMLTSVIVVFAVMGAGKTEFITDVILTKGQQMRLSALEVCREVDFSFPNFQWIKFERHLDKMFDSHELYSLESIKRHVHYLRRVHDRYQTDATFRKFYDRKVRKGVVEPILWGYNEIHYKPKHDNGLIYENIFDALCDYAQAYYLFGLVTSLVLSNYSIICKDEKVSEGNFPTWIMDFFSRPSFDPEEDTTLNAHILDNDMLRLRKKMKKNNEYANALDFGAIGYSEADKERGNMLDTIELKKLSDETNQKNDGFNDTVKMSRHFSSIRFRRYFFLGMDMQRDNSINADLREIADVVKIESKEKKKLLMPFFDLDELLYWSIVPRFENVYADYRVRRADNILMMYLYKKLATSIKNHYVRSYNRYCCMKEYITINDEKRTHYYIMPKKVHSGVFASDAMGGFFDEKKSISKYGINDIPTYKTVRASLSELERQNSYNVNAWLKNIINND